MRNYSEQELIRGILEGDIRIVNYIYKKHFKVIKKMVCFNSGTIEDSNDIFQETILVIYKKAGQADFGLNCNFGTYLYAIAKKLWLKQLSRRKLSWEDINDTHDYLQFETFEDALDETERYLVYRKHLSLLPEECIRILILYFDRVPYKVIAQKLGLSGEMFVKKKKLQCKVRLIESIKTDAMYQELVELAD